MVDVIVEEASPRATSASSRCRIYTINLNGAEQIHEMGSYRLRSG